MKPNHLIALLATLALAAGLTTRATASTIAYWKFEPGNLYADSSGNGHTLTAAATTSTSGGPGAGTDGAGTSYTGTLYSNPNNVTMSTGALSLGPSDSLITIDNLGLNAYNQITIEWFMKRTAGIAGGYQGNMAWYSGTPADQNGTSGDSSYQVTGNSSTAQILRQTGSGNINWNSATDDVWHEYAITMDRTGGGTGLQLYQDYTLVASNTIAAVAFQNTPFILGKDFYYDPATGSGASRHFNGLLDQFSISSGILGPGTFQSELIPEPSTVMLLGVGGLLVWRQVRKS